MSDHFTLNLLFLNNNQFVWYAVAGVVAVMGLVLVLSFAYSSGKNKVKLVKNPNPNGFTLQRYLLAFKTSSLPGSGLSERVSVRVSITGHKGSTPYVTLSRPLYPQDTLSRGNEDVFLLHFERGVGEVQQVHLYTENYDFQDARWFLKEVNVYDPQKQKKWQFPVKGTLMISGGKREQRFLIDGDTRDWVSRNSLGNTLEKMLNLHSLLTIFGKPLEVGLMVLPLKVGLLSTTVSLLYLSNLLVYIISHMLAASVSLVNLLCYSIIGHVIVWTISCIFELLARNIRPKWAFSEKRQDHSILVTSLYPDCNCDQCQKSGDIHIPGCPLWTGQTEEGKSASSLLKQLVKPQDLISQSVLQVGYSLTRSNAKGSGKSVLSSGAMEPANINSSNVCTNLLHSIVDSGRGKPYLEQLISEIADCENLLSRLGAKQPLDILADSSLGEGTKGCPYSSELDSSIVQNDIERDVRFLKQVNQNIDGALGKLCREIDEFDKILSGHEDKMPLLSSTSQDDGGRERTSEGIKEIEDTLKTNFRETATLITKLKSGTQEDLAVLKTITDLRNPEALHNIMGDIQKLDELLKQGKGISEGKKCEDIMGSTTKVIDVRDDADENTGKTMLRKSSRSEMVKGIETKRKSRKDLSACEFKHSTSRYLLAPNYQDFRMFDFSSMEDFESASETDVLEQATTGLNVGTKSQCSNSAEDEIKVKSAGVKSKYGKQTESQEIIESERDENGLEVTDDILIDESVEPDASADSFLGGTSAALMYKTRFHNILGEEDAGGRKEGKHKYFDDKMGSEHDIKDMKDTEDIPINEPIRPEASESRYSLSTYLLAPGYQNVEDFSSDESFEDFEGTFLSDADAMQRLPKGRNIVSKRFKGKSSITAKDEMKLHVTGVGRKYRTQRKCEEVLESEADQNDVEVTENVVIDESVKADANADSLLGRTSTALKYRTRFHNILSGESVKEIKCSKSRERQISQCTKSKWYPNLSEASKSGEADSEIKHTSGHALDNIQDKQGGEESSESDLGSLLTVSKYRIRFYNILGGTEAKEKKNNKVCSKKVKSTSSKSEKRHISPRSARGKDSQSHSKDRKTRETDSGMKLNLDDAKNEALLKQDGEDSGGEESYALCRGRKTKRCKMVRTKGKVRGKQRKGIEGQMKDSLKSQLTNDDLDKTIDFQADKALDYKSDDDISLQKSNEDYSIEIDDICEELEEFLKQTSPLHEETKGRKSGQQEYKTSEELDCSTWDTIDQTFSSDLNYKNDINRGTTRGEELSNYSEEKQQKTGLTMGKRPHDMEKAQSKIKGKKSMQVSDAVKLDKPCSRRFTENFKAGQFTNNVDDDFLGEGPSNQVWETNPDLFIDEVKDTKATDSSEKLIGENKQDSLNYDIYSESSLVFGKGSKYFLRDNFTEFDDALLDEFVKSCEAEARLSKKNSGGLKTGQKENNIGNRGSCIEKDSVKHSQEKWVGSAERKSSTDGTSGVLDENPHTLNCCEDMTSLELYEYPVVSRKSNSRYYLYEDCTKFDEKLYDEFEATCEKEALMALKQFGKRKVMKRVGKTDNRKIPQLEYDRRKLGNRDQFSEKVIFKGIGYNVDGENHDTDYNSDKEERTSKTEKRGSDILKNVRRKRKDDDSSDVGNDIDGKLDSNVRPVRGEGAMSRQSIFVESDGSLPERKLQVIPENSLVDYPGSSVSGLSTYILITDNDSDEGDERVRGETDKVSENASLQKQSAKSKRVNKGGKMDFKAKCRDGIRENKNFASLLKELSDDRISRLNILSQEITESDNALHLAGAMSSIAVQRLKSTTSSMQSKGIGLNDTPSQSKLISRRFQANDITIEKTKSLPADDLMRSDLDVLMSVVKRKHGSETISKILHDIHELDTALKLSGAENSPVIRDLMSGRSMGRLPSPKLPDLFSSTTEKYTLNGQRVGRETINPKTKRTNQPIQDDKLSPGDDEGRKTTPRPDSKQKVLDLMKLIVEGKKNPELLQNILRDIQALDDVLLKSGVADRRAVQVLMKDSVVFNHEDINQDNDLYPLASKSLHSAKSVIVRSGKSTKLTSPLHGSKLEGIASTEDFNLISNILGRKATSESLEGILRDIEDFDTVLNKSGFGQIPSKHEKGKVNKITEPQGQSENKTDKPELPSFQSSSTGPEGMSSFHMGSEVVSDDNGHSLRMLKSIITNRRKGPFQEILQDITDFDSILGKSDIDSDPRVQKLLDNNRIALWGQSQEKDDYGLLCHYSSQEWNGTAPKTYCQRKDAGTKKKKSSTAMKRPTNNKYSKPKKSENPKDFRKKTDGSSADNQLNLSDNGSGISTKSSKQQAGNEDGVGSESSFLDSFDKRDFLMKKILRTLHGFHILVSSLNDIDYNQLDMLIDLLRKGENKANSELSTEIIEILDKTQGRYHRKGSMLRMFSRVSDPATLEPSTQELSSGILSKSTSSVETTDKSCEAVPSRDYLSDESHQTKPRPSRHRSAPKSTNVKGRYAKSSQRKEKVQSMRSPSGNQLHEGKYVQSDRNDASDESTDNELLRYKTDQSPERYTEEWTDLGVDHIRRELGSLEVTGQHSTETLKPVITYESIRNGVHSSISSLESQRQLTRVTSQVSLAVTSVGPQVEGNLVVSPSDCKPEVCNCVMETLAKALVENTIGFAAQDVIQELESVISVFHRYLVIASTMTLLRKWRIPAHTSLLNEVLQEVFWHLESQGFGLMKHPDLYLSKALLLQRMSQKSKRRYTLTLWPDDQTHGNSTLKLEDIIHVENSLARALRKKAKDCVKAELKVYLKNIESHVAYSKSFRSPKSYLGSVFLFYIDSLTDKTKSFPMEVFSDQSKTWTPRKESSLLTVGDPRGYSVSGRDANRPLKLPGKAAKSLQESRATKTTKAVGPSKRVTFSADRAVAPSVSSQHSGGEGAELGQVAKGEGDGLDSLTTDFKLLNKFVMHVIHDEQNRQELEVSNHLLSNRDKLDNFVIENIQKAVDFQQSQGKEPRLSGSLLEGLKYEVCGYGDLRLSWRVYQCLVVFLGIVVVGSLMYTGFKGQDLTPNESSEWIVCVLCGIVLEMIFFQPLKVIVWETCRSLVKLRSPASDRVTSQLHVTT